MGEQYVYIIRLVSECDGDRIDGVFLDKDLAVEHFENDVKYYRKKNWSVLDGGDECGSGALRRAVMTRRLEEDPGYEHRSLVLERHDIIKR